MVGRDATHAARVVLPPIAHAAAQHPTHTAHAVSTQYSHPQTTAIIGTLAAGAAIYWSEPWLFPLLIAIGFIITNITDRKEDRTLKVGLGVNPGMGGLQVWVEGTGKKEARKRGLWNVENGEH